MFCFVYLIIISENNIDFCISTPKLPLISYANTLELIEIHCIFIYRSEMVVGTPPWISPITNLAQKTLEMNEL